MRGALGADWRKETHLLHTAHGNRAEAANHRLCARAPFTVTFLPFGVRRTFSKVTQEDSRGTRQQAQITFSALDGDKHTL